VAIIEFAINGGIFFLFMFAVINLGYLALTAGDLQRAANVAANEAAIQTASDIMAGGPSDCSTQAQVMAYFNNIAAPVVPASTGLATDESPRVSLQWTNSSASNGYLGASLTVTVMYQWYPIGMPASFQGIDLAVSATQYINDTSGIMTSCS
jgi:Flp pilus assembly protein TadG